MKNLIIQWFTQLLVFLGLRKPTITPDTSPINGFRPSSTNEARRKKMEVDAKRVSSRNANYIFKHRARLWNDRAALRILAKA